MDLRLKKGLLSFIFDDLRKKIDIYLGFEKKTFHSLLLWFSGFPLGSSVDGNVGIGISSDFKDVL